MDKRAACKGASLKESTLTRGTVVWVDLSDARPPEIGKQRPAVIVSNSVHNAALDSVVVVPISSRPPEIPVLRIPIKASGAYEGFAVVPGIRQIKKSRILKNTGFLFTEDLQNLDEAIRLYLND